MYRFVGPDGEFMAPILFVSEDATMKRLDQLTHQAARSAVAKAKEARK
jgi:hypothetical protein